MLQKAVLIMALASSTQCSLQSMWTVQMPEDLAFWGEGMATEKGRENFLVQLYIALMQVPRHKAEAG